MITLSPPQPELSADELCLYYTRDDLLGALPVFVFYGPSTTGNSTQNSSRIQAHIYSLAGFHSFPRLTVAPTSPLYAAVNHLPSEQQGDEISRGLAVSLLSYFAALPKELKTTLRTRAASRRPDGMAPMMFDEMHAGDLAATMEELDDKVELTAYLTSALSTQTLSWVDMDVVLPEGTIRRATSDTSQEKEPLLDRDGLPLYHYGQYNSIIETLGSPAFLPTSKLQRAPSRPTVQNKSKTLSKDQKISLRREMCELVDTESNYVGKIIDLANSVAIEFRRNARSDICDALFPQALTHIVAVNESFYQDILSVLDETENDAIKDIEGGAGNETDLGSPVTQGRRRDPTGSTHFAKALLRWFPKFMGPYQDYLRASSNFPEIIGKAIGSGSSDAPTYLQTFGEQRLRSALIEPVQRLPRYSLLIDNMISLLPSSHSALTSLLQARDIITETCNLDTSTTADITRSSRILRNLVVDWPASLSSAGRLITAVDVTELHPPYVANGGGTAGLLLLFSNIIVLFQKVGENPLSARGVMAEIDRPATSTNALLSSALSLDKGLKFQAALDLIQLYITESEDGHIVRLAMSGPMKDKIGTAAYTFHPSTKVFSLLGPYLGKAARFSEEVAKARIEARFSESLRESGTWTLRSVSPAAGTLGVVISLYEARPDVTLVPTTGLCQIRLTVDGAKTTKQLILDAVGLRVAARITSCNSGIYRLDTEGTDGTCFTDNCTSENLSTSLLARLGTLLRLSNQPQDIRLLESYVSYNRTILENVPMRKHQQRNRSRSFRPLSPVKMISNFLSSQQNTPSKHRYGVSLMKTLPAMPPPPPAKNTNKPPVEIGANEPNDKVVVAESTSDDSRNPFVLLEDTFVAYIVALRSRSGNVVGRVLRNRASADELAVNELYNLLLEDPSRLQAPAEASVDVLFAAFEIFLRRAWKDRMGPLVPTQVLEGMLASFDMGRPVLFSQQFKKSLEDLSPQNKRAFSTTIHLLSELLDASGSDGDRGALIATFAEALVLEGNPHDYIMLLDRIVDDYDNLFDSASTGLEKDNSTPGTGSWSSKRSFNTGSLNSNASSLRKRFGFSTLSRENSKNEPESKVASIWRTLSKSTRSPGDNDSQPASLSKASLIRSRSTDSDNRMLPPSRPASRDRPTTSSSSDETRSRPGSSHLNTCTLTSIGENTPLMPPPLPRKKRRSSLSDLTSLRDPSTVSAWYPLQPRKAVDNQKNDAKVVTPPKTPSPAKQARPTNRQSPQPSGLPRRFESPSMKENSPLREDGSRNSNSPSIYHTPGAISPLKQRSDETSNTNHSPHNRQISKSAIPAPRAGLSERAWPPNSATGSPKKSSQSSQKLRMQSPQKLRKRLSQERNALTATEGSLEAELAKIGEEMATYKLPRSPIKPRSTTTHSAFSQPTLESLSSQLSTLSTTLQAFTTAQTASLASLTSDLETSLLVSDRKARKLDELYREANAENEALYERFNDELGKILGRVRKGEGVEEMKGRLGEAQNEVGRLRKENGKLRRELGILKCLMKDEA